ncbi:MAG: hypothetical protein II885_07015 [Oscillospiraceae bacterium]|nr:hypothetical protein [Oscillospiraceae bacterium]
MIFRQTDYDKNRRDPDAIVYTFSCGTVLRLTRNDFANEEEFRFWKQVSDKTYQEQAPADREWSERTAEWSDNSSGAVTSPEVCFFEKLRQAELHAELTAKLKELARQVTAAQFRRYYLHVAVGMSQRKIAKLEGVSPVAVSKSIHKARTAAMAIAAEEESKEKRRATSLRFGNGRL